MKTETVYNVLSRKDVRPLVQKKGKQDYLSWASAWAYLKEEYPDAQRNVYDDPNTGLIYFTDGSTAYVKVGVVVNDLEHIDYLPIMDFKNQAIKLEKITMFDVNKSIQRSTAKAIAMHGLGLSLWIGEDLIDSALSEIKSKMNMNAKKIKLTTSDDNWVKVRTYIEANKKINIKAVLSNLEDKYIINADTLKEIEGIHDGR